jgi:hypothetical protein
MDHFEKGRVRQLSLQEELETLREDPTAQELLDLLEGQDSERVNVLMSQLTTLAEQEKDYAPEDDQ